MRINSLLPFRGLLVFLMIVGGSRIHAQECVPVAIDAPTDSVVISGLWSQEGGAPESGYTGYLRLKSEGSATYALSVSAIVDEASSFSVSGSNISITPASVSLEPGKTQEIKISIPKVPSAGFFQGMIQLVQQDLPNDCFREIPLILDVKVPGQISLLDADVSLTIKTVEKSWMMKLLPKKIRQEGLFVRVENKGPTDISFSDFSLSLKGLNTQHPINKEDVIWENEDEIIPSGGIATMRFRFTKEAQNSLQPDEYSGALRIHPSRYPDSLSVGITMYARTGVLGALLALFIGILVGRMLKSVNNNQAQMEVMGKYVPIRDGIRVVQDPIAKQALLEEADRLEESIDQIKSAEDAASVQAMIDPLDWKVSQIKVLDRTFLQLQERMDVNKVSDDALSLINKSFNSTRDAILAGDKEAVTSGYQSIKSATEFAIAGERSRDLSGGAKSLDPGVAEELKGIESLLKQGEQKAGEAAPAPVEKSFWTKFTEWFFRIFTILGGINASARVRYGFFRPLVAMVTFLVVLLIGFQEIYLNGGDTFGVEGIYDHLKLFVWGLVSDIFSRTLTDENTVTSLKGFTGAKA